MSLNVSELKRKIHLQNNLAKRVYEVRKQGNLLLTTLLIGNVAVNSAIAIYLGSITSGVLAGIVATGLIVVFGEIVPQAVFSRFALRFGSFFTPFVKVIMYLLYPVSFPIAWLLDRVLGEELSTVYSKHELMKIVEEHRESEHSDVDHDEERIVKGALSFSERTVADVMTKRADMYAINKDRIVDDAFVDELQDMNFSRIPVYADSIEHMVGILFAKDLIDPKLHNQPVHKIMNPVILFVKQNRKLDDVFAHMTQTRQHLFIVKGEDGLVSGVITLENVLEEIIRTEIIDEHDDHPFE